MIRFLKENWFYILAPVVLLFVLLVGLAIWGADGDDSLFIYNIF